MRQLTSLKEEIHRLKVSMEIVANSWKQAEKDKTICLSNKKVNNF